jgi:hypothetical protein
MMEGKEGFKPRPYFGPDGLRDYCCTLDDIAVAGRDESAPGRRGSRRRGEREETPGSGMPVSFELFLRAYIGGQRTFRFRFDGNARKKEEILAMADRFCGLRAIGEDSGHLIVKDLLAESDLSPRAAVRRMHRLARELLEGAIDPGARPEDPQEGDLRLSEVERLGWLVNRQYNLLAMDDALARRLGLPRLKALGYVLVSADLRSIAQAAAGLGGTAGTPPRAEAAGRIPHAGPGLVSLLDTAVQGAFLARDPARAATVIGILQGWRAELPVEPVVRRAGERDPTEGDTDPILLLDRICLSITDIAEIGQELGDHRGTREGPKGPGTGGGTEEG